MAKEKSLKQQLRTLCARRREGSFSTQNTRRRLLTVIADDLRRLGYRNMRLESLKQKHVWALVRDWQARELSVATQKNRMTALRWWANNTRRSEVIAASNDHYGIDRRTYVATHSKAAQLDVDKLGKVTDPYVAYSLRLQQAFGLRREEAIKFQVHYADRGETLRLKANWCKGGRQREIPIRTEAQRALLEEIRQFTGGGPDVSLIPAELRYVDQLHRYEYQTQQSGLSKMHGLRHAYAQDRYLELTGWECPVRGGPSRRELDPDALKTDFDARMAISAELGHGREEVTTVYLGR